MIRKVYCAQTDTRTASDNKHFGERVIFPEMFLVFLLLPSAIDGQVRKKQNINMVELWTLMHGRWWSCPKAGSRGIHWSAERDSPIPPSGLFVDGNDFCLVFSQYKKLFQFSPQYMEEFLHRLVFQVPSICVAPCRRSEMGFSTVATCSWVGGYKERKVTNVCVALFY